MEKPVEGGTTSRMPRAGLLIAVVIIIGFVAWSNWDGDAVVEDGAAGGDPVGETPKPNDFVGSRACAECHSEIAADFSQHPMARTLRPIDEVDPFEVFGGEQDRFTTGERTYRVERRDGEAIHHEMMYDDDGKLLYDQAESVQFVIGAGVKGRSYLLKRGELLFQSPITWYSQISAWALSPGYPAAEHYRFQKRVSEDCLACHSGRIASAAGVNRFVAEKPFHEVSIGCERCHGPGGRHVALFRSSARRHLDDPLIVSPGTLDGQRQSDLCNQCHLEGKSRVLKRGMRFDDFRPGEFLGKTWTVYVAETPFDEEGRPMFTSHVEQMHSSRCFQKSGKSMRCTSCHDPHRVPSADERAEFYKARCNNCHQKQGCSLPEAEQQKAPAAGSCIACHMSKLDSRDLAHSTQADHRVLRHARETPLFEKTEQDHIERPWHPFGTMGELLSKDERIRADTVAWLRQANDTGDIRLLERVRRQLAQILAKNPSDAEVRGLLGYAWFRSGNLVTARRELERALQERPDFERYLGFLGLIAYSTKDDEGARYFRRLLELNPHDGRAYGPYTDMLEATGKLDEAIEWSERGLARDPSTLDLRRSLVRFYRKAGRVQDALEQERILGQIGKRLERAGR